MNIVWDVINNGGNDVGLFSIVFILEFNGFDKSKIKKKNICWKLCDFRFLYFLVFLFDMEDDIEVIVLWIFVKFCWLLLYVCSNRLWIVGGFEFFVFWENYVII